MTRHSHSRHWIAIAAAVGCASMTLPARERAERTAMLVAPQGTSALGENRLEKASRRRLRVMEAVGCLSARPNDNWLLTNATSLEPASMSGRPDGQDESLGTRTFRLMGLGIFNPSKHADHKVRVQGLPVKDGVNVTSLKMLSEVCTK